MRKSYSMIKNRQCRGFTLVEISLVLVVIGLILGAVSIGKDLQRNAEYKKVKQKFIDQWVLAYNQYYDRIGVVPGDDPSYPAQVVYSTSITDAGSGNYSASLANVLQSAADPASSFTQEQADATMLCGVAPTTAYTSNVLRNYFVEAGIELPPGRDFNQEDKYIYLDSNGNPHQIDVCFRWLVPAEAGAGNSMIISGLTPDLAKMLDVAIDGRAEGESGRFRCVDEISDYTAKEWPDNDTGVNSGEEDIASIGSVVAVYRMAQ
jgi:prepilin-type N-terminal cleavage/methylation domain-containing protein